MFKHLGLLFKPMTPQRRSSKFSRSTKREDKAVLITDAEVSPGEDRHRREIIYSLLQFIRIPSLLLGFFLYWRYDMWVLPAFIVGITFPLPWIAVVIANGKGQPKDKRQKNVYKPAIARQIKQQAESEALKASQGKALTSSESPTVIDHYSEGKYGDEPEQDLDNDTHDNPTKRGS